MPTFQYKELEVVLQCNGNVTPEIKTPLFWTLSLCCTESVSSTLVDGVGQLGVKVYHKRTTIGRKLSSTFFFCFAVGGKCVGFVLLSE